MFIHFYTLLRTFIDFSMTFVKFMFFGAFGLNMHIFKAFKAFNRKFMFRFRENEFSFKPNITEFFFTKNSLGFQNYNPSCLFNPFLLSSTTVHLLKTVLCLSGAELVYDMNIQASFFMVFL